MNDRVESIVGLDDESDHSSPSPLLENAATVLMLRIETTYAPGLLSLTALECDQSSTLSESVESPHPETGSYVIDDGWSR